MVEKSQRLREKADEYNAAFDEAYDKSDNLGAAFHAMDAITAERQAAVEYCREHPELERLDRLNSTLSETKAVLTLCLYCLAAVVVLLCVIAYKNF